MGDIVELDAVAVVDRLRSGALRAEDYAEAIVEAASKHASLNALYSFDAAGLNARIAAGLTQGGSLAGLPLLIKDNINTADFPTTGGTGALQGHHPGADAPALARLKNQGAVTGAKAALHELAFGITSNNAVTGAVRNPADPNLIAGGSSGGTAAGVAAGIFAAGLGTDTGGSCRIPAALCGCVGFRPTTGRYPGAGVIPISHTRDTIGPIARSVRDITMLDAVLAGQDATDQVVDDLRIGIVRDVFFNNLDPHTDTVIAAQLDALIKAGVQLIEITLPDIWDHNEAFGFPVVLYEAMRDLPAYLAEFAPDVSFEALLAGVGSPDVAGVLQSQLGDGAMPQSAYDAAIHKHRPAMRAIYDQAFDTHDLHAIAFPTTPLPARPIGQDETVMLNGGKVPTFPTYIRNTDLASNLGVPGISLPCPVGDGLPVGLELDGRAGRDTELLAVAARVERILR